LPFDRGPHGTGPGPPGNAGTKQNTTRSGRKKTPLLPHERKHFGDPLWKNDSDKSALIGFMNVNGLPIKAGGTKNQAISDLMNDYNFSHLGMAETNCKWNLLYKNTA
jgi:hypothetical protein